MRWLLKPLRWLYAVYAMLCFVAIMLVIFPFVIVSSFFGRIRGGNMILALCRLWADTWFPLVLIFHRKIFEAPHDKSKAYIFVTNHISYLDAAIIVKAYRQPLRPLGKIEMGKVPVFGFIYRNAIVAVDRRDAAHRAESVRILKSVLKKGISVLVFPEGTFNMTHRPLKDFYDGAFRVAIETQTPIKPVLFLDAYARLHYGSLFSLNPGICRVVYLAEIPVEGLGPADVQKLKERVFAAMWEKLIAYKASWIGAGPAN